MAKFTKLRLASGLDTNDEALPQPFDASSLEALWNAGERIKTDPKSSVTLLHQGNRRWLIKRSRPSPGKALLYKLLPLNRTRNRLRGSERLAAAGIPCGRVLAYYEMGKDLYSLQEFVPNNGSLLDCAEDGRLEEPALHAAIKLLGELHAAGLSHGDAKFGNILLDKHNQPLFVDLDGVRRVGRYNRWQAKDLARFLYELERFFPTSDPDPLIATYRAACGEPRGAINIEGYPPHFQKIADRFARRTRPTKEFHPETGSGLPANILFLATSKRERRYFEKLAPHFSGNCEIVNLRKMPVGRSLPPMFDRALFRHSDRWFDFKLDKTFGPGQHKIQREIYRLALKTSSRFFLRGFSRTCEGHHFDALVQWNGFHYMQQAARSFAESRGMATITMEHGYLPETMAIDPSGVNYDNAIPRDTEFYRHYRPHHTPFNRRLVQRKPVKPVGNEVSLPEHYLFAPFQVANDSQILVHSPRVKTMYDFYGWLEAALAGLPKPWHIVIKEHPSCACRYPDLYRRHPRIIFANANNTQELIERSAGVLTINSTVGVEALMLGRPVITVGDACYNIPQLVTHVASNQELTSLLQQPDTLPYDQRLVDSFIDYLATDYLVPGKRVDISPETCRLAAARIFQLLEQEQDPANTIPRMAAAPRIMAAGN